MKINNKLSCFVEEGYVVKNLQQLRYLNIFKDRILKELQSIVNSKKITLENFHQFIKDDEQKLDIQYSISKIIWEEQLHLKIIEDNIELYHEIFGKDLDIQSKPHLRIVRPHYPQDNIGFHRDTQYGNNAYEISNFFPLVNLDKNSSLQVEPSSHKKGTLPYTKINNEKVEKGSIENQLGYPYEPKVIDKSFQINAIPIPIKFSQVLILGLGTIHGQEVNKSNITRWSIDIRVKNSFAKSNVKEGYYTKLSSSIITNYANEYYKVCND